MPKRETSNSLSAARLAAVNEEAIQTAMRHLGTLSLCRRTLTSEHKSILRNVIKSLDEEIQWLIDESEIYRDAAARLYSAQPMTHDGEPGDHG